MNDHKYKPRLSRGLLEMKFMKRCKTKLLAELNEDEGKEYYNNEVTEGMKSIDKFVIEPSYVPCEQLIVGRVSYGGMNSDIEKIMAQERALKRPPPPPETDVDVTAEEMAGFKSSLHSTIANKFDTKRQKRKKAKFMKPDE